MTQTLLSLSDCLFEAFTNQQFNNTQEHRINWAIYEGLRRIDPHFFEWSAPNARKEHECIRGCKIKEGEDYFKHNLGSSYGNVIKFCASCMGMVLYYMNVEKKPPYMYTHWDEEAQEPVFVGKRDQNKYLKFSPADNLYRKRKNRE